MSDDLIRKISTNSTAENSELSNDDAVDYGAAVNNDSAGISQVQDNVEPANHAGSFSAENWEAMMGSAEADIRPIDSPILHDIRDKAGLLEPQGPGQVIDQIAFGEDSINWDAVQTVSDELQKPNPDANLILQTLESLPPAQFMDTLKEFQKEGKMNSVIQAIDSNPESFSKMSDFMQMFAKVSSNLGLAGDTGIKQIAHEMIFLMFNHRQRPTIPIPGAEQVIQDFTQKMIGTKDAGVFSDELTHMMGILGVDNQTIGNNLLNQILANKLVQEVQGRDYDEAQDPAVGRMLDNFLAGSNNATVGEALKLFPSVVVSQFGGSDNEVKLARLINRFESTNQDFGSVLASIAKNYYPASNYPTMDIISNSLDSLAGGLGDEFSGDVARKFISGLGNEAVDILSKMRPDVLLNLEQILKNDTANAQANQDLINNIVQPAFDIAKTNYAK